VKVFVAGATGVLGRALVPQLVVRGHEVVGMTRSASKQELVRRMGGRPIVADALDPDAVAQAVASAEPEVIVHELTAFSGPTSVGDARRTERSVAVTMTNRMRTEATDHLLAAGHPNGEQPLDLFLDLRRRRYGASHGVGSPSSSRQDLREPTPCPRPARLTHSTPERRLADGTRECSLQATTPGPSASAGEG
jgi:NAD dependent epimerase/dehydratase family